MRARPLAFVANLAMLVVGCQGGARSAQPGACGGAFVIDTYPGGIAVDPYFYGYAGDPTFGGDSSWGDPSYYDPSYDDTGDPGSDDTSDNGSSSDSTGSEDSSGGDTSQSLRLRVTSGPVLGEACTPCAVACTFAMPGGSVPVGQVAVGERSPDDPSGECIGAVLAIQQASNGAALSRCRAVDPGLGRIPAMPMVAPPSSSAASGGGMLLLHPPRTDLGP